MTNRKKFSITAPFYEALRDLSDIPPNNTKLEFFKKDVKEVIRQKLNEYFYDVPSIRSIEVEFHVKIDPTNYLKIELD